MNDDGSHHWDAVFASRDLDTVSRFEETPTHSVELLRQQGGSVIDIGAGASRLPDALLTDGRDDITVLDISREALAVTRERLGSAEGRVAYVVSDVLSWEPSRTYDAWHDRAVLHFLTEPAPSGVRRPGRPHHFPRRPAGLGHIRPRRTRVLLGPADGPPLRRGPRRPRRACLHPYLCRNADPSHPRRPRAAVHLDQRSAHGRLSLICATPRAGDVQPI
ncbi:MAG: class I SAM-dependent methyltransferase [Nocardioides sp.]|nr:class I SAM-dependent methyltransferase [Nocardioides sp.]